MQCLFPKHNSYYNIIDLIIQTILLYYYVPFESSILNQNEKQQLLNLFQKYNKDIVNHHWQTIFDSKKHKINRDVIADKVHKRPNILVLVRINGEFVIGGYTKTGWFQRENSDKDAFVYFLKSSTSNNSFISNVIEGCEAEAIGYTNAAFFGFGAVSWIMYFGSGYLCMQEIHLTTNYEDFPEKHGKYLIGDTNIDSLIAYEEVELEVFQISQ